MAADFGKRICAGREKAGLTQQQLAKALRISLQQVSDWENGTVRPTLMQVPMVCYALSMSYEAFFGSSRKGAKGKKRAPAGCWQCSLLPAMYRYVIRQHRTARGLTLQEFAKQTGVSSAAAEKWEAGKAIPSLDEVPRICDTLHIRLWQFFE